ncbi:hypothetical protein B7463_g7057, partial [Scytalidium lignicola]
MYPNKDAPYYLSGFTGTVSLLAVSVVTYLTLPFLLKIEASRRKRKTGHALPLQSLEDSEHSQVSEAAMEGIRQLNQLESEGKIKAVVDQEKPNATQHTPPIAEHVEISRYGKEQV